MSRNLLSMNATPAGLAATLVLGACLAAPAHAANKAASKKRRVIDIASCAKPEYPTADIQATHEGAVTIEFKLDQGGAVTDSKIEKSSGFASLDEAARSALAKCKFSAAKPGVKYAEWTPVKYVWTLK